MMEENINFTEGLEDKVEEFSETGKPKKKKKKKKREGGGMSSARKEGGKVKN